MRFSFVFFLMIRRPPRSTLFPTRRSSDLRRGGRRRGPRERARPGGRRSRSEEYTSELQSQFHLVCRLLLEKKKNKKKYQLTTKKTKIKIRKKKDIIKQ